MRSETDSRNSWLERLNVMRRSPQPVPRPKVYRAPSRANRKALTTWQDAAALKQLRHLANDLGTSQQALVAEGIAVKASVIKLDGNGTKTAKTHAGYRLAEVNGQPAHGNPHNV